MRNETRIKYRAYLAEIAALNGVDQATVAQTFTVEPTVEQTLEKKIQESSSFLSAINVYPVMELAGNKIGMGIGAPIVSTTDTEGGDERTPRDLTTLDEKGYVCTRSDYDTFIPYATLDLWAKFPNFQIMARDQVVQRTALDRIMVGWNGTSRAVTSDRSANPLGQDVNLGWLYKMRQYNAARVLAEVVADSDVVTVGALADGTKGDYANLDALVFDAKSTLLAQWHRQRPDLVCIVGDELLKEYLFPMIEAHGATPSERAALDMIISSKRIGGLAVVQVPYFPSRSILITPLRNLSMYFQEGSRRRHLVENPKLRRVEDYNQVNEAYVIEDYEACALVENISLPNADGSAWDPAATVPTPPAPGP